MITFSLCRLCNCSQFLYEYERLSAALTMDVICGQKSLTNAGVEAGVCFEDIISREVNNITAEAQMAADRGLWLQLRNSFCLGRGTGACMEENTGIRYKTCVLNNRRC